MDTELPFFAIEGATGIHDRIDGIKKLMKVYFLVIAAPHRGHFTCVHGVPCWWRAVAPQEEHMQSPVGPVLRPDPLP